MRAARIQRGAAHVVQDPLVPVMRGALRPLETAELAIVGEGEHAHVAQLHFADPIALFQRRAARVDDVMAIARPQPAAIAQAQVARAHAQLHRLRLLVAPRSHRLAQDHHAHDQHRHHARGRAGDAQSREAGRAQRRELAAAGQRAETEQAADQRGIAEHLVGAARKRHQHVDRRIGHRVAMLADIAELAQELGHRVEAGQHQPHGEQRTEHAQRHQSIHSLDAQHAHHAALVAVRTRRGEYCFHSNQPASPSASRCKPHRGAWLCQWSLPICARPSASSR